MPFRTDIPVSVVSQTLMVTRITWASYYNTTQTDSAGLRRGLRVISYKLPGDMDAAGPELQAPKEPQIVLSGWLYPNQVRGNILPISDEKGE